jgi:hypothetical protein
MARLVRFGVRSRKLPKIYCLELLRASEGTLSRWSRMHLQSLASTNLHWGRVEDYGPFCLYVIHKEGLCPSIRGINALMMMMLYYSVSDATKN